MCDNVVCGTVLCMTMLFAGEVYVRVLYQKVLYKREVCVRAEDAKAAADPWVQIRNARTPHQIVRTIYDLHPLSPYDTIKSFRAMFPGARGD